MHSLWFQQRLVCGSVWLQPSGWHPSTEFYSHQVFTCPLPRYSPQVFTRPLWGRIMLPTRHLVSLCIDGCWALKLRPSASFAIRMWRSSFLTLCRLVLLWFWLSRDLRVQILSHIHHISLHSLHGSPDYVYISFCIWQLSCMFFYFIDGRVLVVMGLFLNLLIDRSNSSRHFPTCSCHFLESEAQKLWFIS